MPVWHSSVAVWRRGEIVPTEIQHPRHRRLAQELCLSVLEGVGVGETRRERFAITWQARRRLSPEEIAAQTPEWCAIQAVHSGGEGEPW